MEPTGVEPLSVTVAVLTRRRRRMLSALLDSLAALTPPDECHVRFLVVENDGQPFSRDIVDARGGRLPVGPLNYVLEPELGIPFGRNRAAREAIAANHRLLAFVDDDEIVEPEWLARLVAGYRKSKAALVGGPHRACAPDPRLSWQQRRLHDGIRRRYQSRADRAAARAGLTGTPGVTITTGNWLGETAIFSQYGIWFDGNLRFSGGEDAKFSAEVKKAGLPTAWVADAWVCENVPAERLTFAYQFKRARAQSNNTFRLKVLRAGSVRWSVLVSIPLKLLSAGLLACLLLPTSGRTLLALAHTTGWIAGRLDALFDIPSSHYTETTGD